MRALTVTLGADITALKRALAGATELVGASARGWANSRARGWQDLVRAALLDAFNTPIVCP